MKQSCKNSFTAFLFAAFLALLTEQTKLKNRGEALASETQCIPELAAETEKLG